MNCTIYVHWPLDYRCIQLSDVLLLIFNDLTYFSLIENIAKAIVLNDNRNIR